MKCTALKNVCNKLKGDKLVKVELQNSKFYFGFISEVTSEGIILKNDKQDLTSFIDYSGIQMVMQVGNGGKNGKLPGG